MKNLRICIDMDDTIEWLVKSWARWLENKYHFGVKYEDITDWNIFSFYPELTSDQVCEPLNTPEFWDTVEPMKDAQEVIPRLMQAGHEIYICTSTHYKTAPFKFDRCLFKHFPFISHKNVIISYNKQMIKCDILIDDGFHNIVGDYIGLLMNVPSNSKYYTGNLPKVFRVFDWYDIENKITAIANAE
jgi:5'(3')-deoxyribonucleotidase